MAKTETTAPVSNSRVLQLECNMENMLCIYVRSIVFPKCSTLDGGFEYVRSQIRTLRQNESVYLISEV